jgi:uncharacterized DUF497 family protein
MCGIRRRPGRTSPDTAFGSEAVAVLEDELALTVRDPFSEDEERWITLDINETGRLLVVVYAWRGDNVRLISARPATPREKSQY